MVFGSQVLFLPASFQGRHVAGRRRRLNLIAWLKPFRKGCRRAHSEQGFPRLQDVCGDHGHVQVAGALVLLLLLLLLVLLVLLVLPPLLLLLLFNTVIITSSILTFIT